MKTINSFGLLCASLLGTSLLMGCTTQEQPKTVSAGAGCQSLGDTQSTLAAFYGPGNAYSATPVKKKFHIARAAQPERTVGATIYVRAQPGLTSEYLQRTLACHAVNGKPMNPNDPLHLDNGNLAELSVQSAGNSLAVRVTGEGSDVGREIWQRAQAFTSDGGAVQVEQVSSAAEASTAF